MSPPVAGSDELEHQSTPDHDLKFMAHRVITYNYVINIHVHVYCTINAHSYIVLLTPDLQFQTNFLIHRILTFLT